MINLYVAKKTYFDKRPEALELHDFVLKNMRKALGKEIKKYIKYGIKPSGKIKIKYYPDAEDFDGGQLLIGQIPMQGDFFSVLHARRAGLGRLSG